MKTRGLIFVCILYVVICVIFGGNFVIIIGDVDQFIFSNVLSLKIPVLPNLLNKTCKNCSSPQNKLMRTGRGGREGTLDTVKYISTQSFTFVV